MGLVTLWTLWISPCGSCTPCAHISHVLNVEDEEERWAQVACDAQCLCKIHVKMPINLEVQGQFCLRPIMDT